MGLVRSLIVLWTTALAAQVASGEPVRVAAVSACPKSETGCLEMQMRWDITRADKPPFDAQGLLAVRGRLGEGDVDWVRLKVSVPTPSGLDLGQVAYLGRSREGRPIILTDQGPLAIETRGVHVGRGAAVVIVDTKAASVTREFLGGLVGATYVIADAKRIGVLTKNGACVSPPSMRPGALKPVAHCGGPHQPIDGLGFSERVTGAVSAAPDADLALIRRLLPQTAELDDETLRLKIGRIDARHLVVTPW